MKWLKKQNNRKEEANVPPTGSKVSLIGAYVPSNKRFRNTAIDKFGRKSEKEKCKHKISNGKTGTTTP